MRHTLFFLFLLFSSPIIAQYTTIPDISFEKSLISQGIDSGVPDGKVLTSSISNIATLSIGARNISDLTGIEDFINLTELRCQANNLTTLDLSKNLKLENLDCYTNQLTNLNVTKNLNLKTIECQENKLTSLDVSSIINLTYLDFSNNYITNIDLSKNITLQFLQVNFNLLKNLDVSKNINLMNLQCVENQLKTLDLSKNPDLYLLYCRDNQLSSLDVSKNPKIRYISCYNNNLTSLNLKNGKNTAFNTSFWYYCNFKFNPDLKCILVDNSAYSNTNWSDLKDATASYSDNLDIGPSSTSPQTFCIQQNAVINNITITGQNIKWYDALTNGNLLSNTTSLQNAKTYYASQTINGCESERIAVLINIQNTPAPTGDSNQSFCSTQNATLNDIEITGTNIKWYNSSNIALPNTTFIGNNATYYASQTINNCESINKLLINTTLINTLNANNYEVEFCDENNDGKETIDLSEFNPNLITNPSDNSFSYYTTLTAAENQIANSRINNISNYVLPKGSYTVFVRIDSPNGCHQVVELGLNLYSKPIIPINDITPICEGSSITVNAGEGYDNYLWSTGETSATITIQNPGDYSVTVTNNYDLISCSSTKDFTIKKSTIATINSIETKDWTDNQNIIKVFVSGEGDFEYSIDGIHFQDNNEFSNVISGQYTVLVRDKNGCGTVTDEVYLLMYPHFFTPNGDGYNDSWKIKFSDSEKNITIKIFDRYGKLLKHLLPDAAWNGQFNNQELPADDYWFIVTRADGKEYKGHFSLKR